uniref:Ribonuclease-III-like protein n=1 Tax=Megaviridae environmental sample TaxID=1737588 RepID=A0A5J6VKC8_9VIRU|nr:MAG: ribonuclease-III-like protein [Megaviridae environmental sample]
MTNYLETGVVIYKEDSEEVYHIPYNINNILITNEDIIDILNTFGIEVEEIKNIENFYLATTHKSYVKKDVFTPEILNAAKIEMGNPSNLLELRDESYERLEFFGDRVIKIIVSMYLYYRYKSEDEGFMTRLQTKIEDKSNLAKMSKCLGLQKYFLISKQIENLNGRNLDRIHEDVFEAFMGALFLSLGFETVLLLMTNLLETCIDYSEKLYKDNNYKDALLRYHHKQKFSCPKYIMLHYEGQPHKREYIMGVENPNNNTDQKYNCISFGKGSSKKEGEQNAAKMALIIYGVLLEDQYSNDDLYYPDLDCIQNNSNSSDN